MEKSCVSLSSTQSEYMAISDCLKNAIWAKGLHTDIGERIEPAVLYEDNMGTIKWTTKGLHRSNHVAFRAIFLRNCIARNCMVVKHCTSKHQLVAIHTKSFSSNAQIRLRDHLGVLIIKNWDSRECLL